IGEVWVRIPAGPPTGWPSLVQSMRAYYRQLLRTRRIGPGRNLCPFDSKAVQVFAQAIGIVRGRFAASWRAEQQPARFGKRSALSAHFNNMTNLDAVKCVHFSQPIAADEIAEP